MSHYVYRNLQATEISKLQRRLHYGSIHSDIIHFIVIAIRSFYDEERLT